MKTGFGWFAAVAALVTLGACTPLSTDKGALSSTGSIDGKVLAFKSGGIIHVNTSGRQSDPSLRFA